MRTAHQPVTLDDTRKREDGRCFYCTAYVGEQHDAECVCRKRTVVCEIKLTIVREVPESWDEDMINFHMNGSSWCADNIVDELEKYTEGEGCLCPYFEGKYLREATEEDEA